MKKTSKKGIEYNKEKNSINKKLILTNFLTSILKFAIAIALLIFVITITVTAGDVIIENGKLNVSDNLYVDGAGNVGIGIAIPTQKLDVIGSIKGTALCIGTDCRTSWLGSSLPNGTLGQTLMYNGSAWINNSFLFNNGTNAGIGTINPADKLTVVGVISTTSGGVRFPDGTLQTTAASGNGSGGGWSGGGLSDWSYRRVYNLNNAGSALINYQLDIVVDTASLISAGKMLSNCADARFTDSDKTTNVNFWLESGCNTASTKFWVNVPSIPTGAKTIYIYYGNSAASSTSDLDTTMDVGLRAFYYDGTNFNTYLGTCVDTNAPNYNWGSGIVSIPGCPNSQSDTVSIRWQGWIKNRGSGSHTFWVTTDDGSRLYVPNTTTTINTWIDQAPTEYSGTSSFSNPVTIKYEWYENGGGTSAKLGWSPADGSGKVYPIPSTYVRNRKYAVPEPSATAGVEESSSAGGGSGGGWTDGGANVYLTTSTDNVGIGTTSPGAKLDVRGAIYNPSNPSLTVSPTGNPPSTLSTLVLQGTTVGGSREFLAHFGLTSNQAGGDKVALYAATVGEAGTSDLWALNSVTTLSAGSGNYNAQGYELDFNNMNANRGDMDAGSGLAAPVAYGLSITGASSQRSTAALLISSPGTQIWNRGIVIANNAIANVPGAEGSSFQDLSSPHKSIDIRGAPTFGIYQSNAATLNYFAGNVGIGTSNPSAKLEVIGSIIATCPSGMISADAFCIEASERVSSTWFNAVDNCGDAGRRLCSASEWYYGCLNLALNQETNNFEWTGDRQNSVNVYAIGNGGCANDNTVDEGTSQAYRCCIDKKLSST